jgi:hypothetical protein
MASASLKGTATSGFFWRRQALAKGDQGRITQWRLRRAVRGPKDGKPPVPRL